MNALLSRFIAPNGRWYLGRLLSRDRAQATVQFEHPSEPYMLHSLQVSAAALQPYNPQQTQTALSDLQPGSTVFARLSQHGLFERSELHGFNPVLTTATVTVVSSGVQHQLPVDQIIQTVTLNDTDQLINSNSDSEIDHDSDVDSLSDDMALSEDEAEVQNGTTHHSTAALAVLDADLAASQVCAPACLCAWFLLQMASQSSVTVYNDKANGSTAGSSSRAPDRHITLCWLGGYHKGHWQQAAGWHGLCQGAWSWPQQTRHGKPPRGETPIDLQ